MRRERRAEARLGHNVGCRRKILADLTEAKLRSAVIGVSCILALAACSTGPGTSNVSGKWIATSTSGLTACVNMTLQLVQTDTTVSGSYADNTCGGLGPPQGPLSGTNVHDSVTIALDPSLTAIKFTGTLSATGDTILGSLGGIPTRLVRD